MNINNFNFPEINYSYWLSQHGDNNNNLNNGLGLTTRFMNLRQMYPQIGISDEVIELKTMGQAVNFIEQKISNYPNLSDQDYLDIFDAINNWGGRMIQKGIIYARQTLRNNLDEHNWFENYKKAAHLLQLNKLEEGIAVMLGIPGLGISFGSKHIAFWAFDNESIAIYDSKISQVLLRSKNPRKKDIIPFLSAIKDFSSNHSEICHNKTPQVIEKALFAFHKFYWTNDGVWLGNTQGEDLNLAIEINLTLQQLIKP